MVDLWRPDPEPEGSANSIPRLGHMLSCLWLLCGFTRLQSQLCFLFTSFVTSGWGLSQMFPSA